MENTGDWLESEIMAFAYVETIISEVIVTDDEVLIKGPNAALMQQTTAFAASGELVPSFAQQWRTISDKTANWRMALNY